MALKIAAGIIEPSTTESIANCIFAIDTATFDNTNNVLTIICFLYANAAAATAKDAPLFTFSYTYSSSASGGVSLAPILTSMVSLASSQTNPFIASLYTNLPNHPAASAMLAGTTVVGTLSN